MNARNTVLNENPNQFSSHRVTIETKNQSRNPRPITGGIKSQNQGLLLQCQTLALGFI